MRKIGFAPLVLLLGLLFLFTSAAEAGFLKDVKKKVEHKLGWDRYIYCWGDTFVPPENRWVAIRPGQERKKGDIGKFWDVPGDGKKVGGNQDKVQIWDITFQESPQDDRRYHFIHVYDQTKKAEDFGYYYIQSKTGAYVVEAGNKIVLRMSLDKGAGHRRYMWAVRNVDDNKFMFLSRSNGRYIYPDKGKGTSNGSMLVLSPAKSIQEMSWEFIYIAVGGEVKSTSEMAKARAKVVERQAKEVAGKVEEIGKKVAGRVKATVQSLFESLESQDLISMTHDKSKRTMDVKLTMPDFGKPGPLGQVKNTIDKLYKLERKDLHIKSVTNNDIKAVVTYGLTVLGAEADLTVGLSGNLYPSKDGIRYQNIKVSDFKLTGVPKKIADSIRKEISKETSRMDIMVKAKYFPQMYLVIAANNMTTLRTRELKDDGDSIYVKMSY